MSAGDFNALFADVTIRTGTLVICVTIVNAVSGSYLTPMSGGLVARVKPANSRLVAVSRRGQHRGRGDVGRGTGAVFRR